MFSQAFFEIQHSKNSISISLGQQRQEQSNLPGDVECYEKRGQFFNQIFSHKICVNELQHNRFVNNSQKLISGVVVVIGHQIFCPLWILLNGVLCKQMQNLEYFCGPHHAHHHEKWRRNVSPRFPQFSHPLSQKSENRNIHFQLLPVFTKSL